MESIAEIQEIVDENKDQMPTGAATAIMKKCQEAYIALPKLYHLEMVRVKLVDGYLHHTKETRILEQCSQDEWTDLTYRYCKSFFSVLHFCKMPEDALKWPLPDVDSNQFGNQTLEVVIIVSITPYRGKRSRED